MIDIDQITELLERRPLDTLAYSLKEGKFFNVKETMDPSQEDDDLCYFCGAKVCYRVARLIFREKHHDLFPNAPSSYSYKKWFETIEQKGLEEEWFLELRQALAENVTEFCKHYGLQEIEAPNRFYDDIKHELKILERTHYETRYSDMVLFHLRTYYEIVPFTILGNAGNVFGISFYPSDDDGTCFMRTQLNYALHIDQNTLSSLSNMLSFYFEKGKREDILDNPYGKDNHYTSLYMTNGSFMRVYLPKSVAIRALDFLKKVNLLMPLFDKTKGKEIEDNRFYDVFLDVEKTSNMVFEKDLEEDSKINLLPEIDSCLFPDTRYAFTPKEGWDVTIRALPNYFKEIDDSPRCGHFAFICLICDHKTGHIILNELGESSDFRLFDEIIFRLERKLKDMRIPKKLYVNSYLDFVFLQSFFDEDLAKGKTEIIPSINYLATDEAFDGMIDFFSKNEMDIAYKA